MSFAERYAMAVIAGASEGTGSAFARKVARRVNCILMPQCPAAALADVFGPKPRRLHHCTCRLARPMLRQHCRGRSQREMDYSSAMREPIHGSHFLDRDLVTWTQHVQRNVVIDDAVLLSLR